MSLKSRAFTTLVLLLAASGCAGGSLGRIGSGETELPKDLQDKFEVKDASVGAVTVPVEVTPAQVTLPAADISSKKKRSKKTKAPTAGTGSAELASKVTVYPSRRPTKEPIWIGEKHVFSITYFGVSAGDFTLEALPHKLVNNRKVYHIRGTAVSSQVFSLFYRLNDMIESFIDYDGLFSHRFHLVLDETKQSRDSLELFDSEKGETYFWNRWNHKEKGYSEVKEYKAITPFSQDSLSALYYLRTIPLPPGAVVTFPVVSEGKTWEAQVTVIRRETYDGPNGPIPAVVVKPETKYQGVLQKKGDSYLWLSDDDRRFVLRLEAKVRIGTVIAAAKEILPGSPPNTEP